jgi:glycosyltransferase involved in cell wall biosynthesis
VQYSVSPLLKNSISTVHDVSFCVDPSWFTYRDRILLKLGVSSAAKRASAVITVSQTSKKEIERHFNQAKGKVKAIYNACPTWVQKQDPFVARSIVQSLGITGPYVLTVGTDWARKNMKLAVESMRKVSKEHEHRLVITGKGSGELDDFVLRTGYVSNEVLGALYSCADIYLAPSLHEGFGIPILEAFRCGTPVLCGSGGAMPEVAGGAAVVAADYSVASWVSSIHELLSTPSKLSSLVRAGTSREHDFSWDRAANETMEVYREVWSRLTKER